MAVCLWDSGYYKEENDIFNWNKQTNKQTKNWSLTLLFWKNYQNLQIMFCFPFESFNREFLFRVSMRKGDQGLLISISLIGDPIITRAITGFGWHCYQICLNKLTSTYLWAKIVIICCLALFFMVHRQELMLELYNDHFIHFCSFLSILCHWLK